MKSFLKLGRVIILATLVATLMVSCAPGNLFPSPTPPPTASLTLTPTSTSTPFPTPTETLAPTPTKELTLEQQHERDFGKFVPQGEACVRYKEASMGGFSDWVKSDAFVAELKFHYTGQNKNDTIPMGPVRADGTREEREVKLIQVVCRDKNGAIEEPIWVVLGGIDFGKDRDGKNIYWTNDGGSIVVTTPDQILTQIDQGEEIRIILVTKNGSGSFRDHWENHGGGNESAQEAARQLSEKQEQINQLVEEIGVNESDFELFPLMIKLGPFSIP